MECRTCKRTDAWTVRTIVDNGQFYDDCNFCGYTGSNPDAFGDVYFPRPHACENITDDSGRPIFFESRAHKARVMKEKGIREAGDRIRGSYEVPKPSGRSWYEQRRKQGLVK